VRRARARIATGRSRQHLPTARGPLVRAFTAASRHGDLKPFSPPTSSTPAERAVADTSIATRDNPAQHGLAGPAVHDASAASRTPLIDPRDDSGYHESAPDLGYGNSPRTGRESGEPFQLCRCRGTARRSSARRQGSGRWAASAVRPSPHPVSTLYLTSGSSPRRGPEGALHGQVPGRRRW
jgi:hypothetical protein